MILRLVLFLYIIIDSTGSDESNAKLNQPFSSKVKNGRQIEGKLLYDDWESTDNHGKNSHLLDPCKKYSNTNCGVCLFKSVVQVKEGSETPIPPKKNCYFCFKDKSCRSYPGGSVFPSFAGECFMSDTYWKTCIMSMKAIMYMILIMILMISLCCCICLCKCFC
ncbi:unnamed protein product [Gordionus sp. m RMFG-2023]